MDTCPVTVKTPTLLLFLQPISQQIRDFKIEGLIKAALATSAQVALKRKR